ncbi:Protein BONZAI 1 [Linum perenne]
MGNCFSDEVGGRSAVGGTGASSAGAGANDAVDQLLRYRGFHGLFSQIEFLNLEVYLLQSDPMVVVYTKGRDGALTEAFRTEVILNSLNPSWIAKCTVTFQFEIVQTLVFRVYDIDTQFHNVDVKMLKLEEQQFLGEASSILSKVLKGQLFVDKLLESTQHTFLDYLRGGYELNFMVAVDFTAANHFQAILEVGEVLKFYDSDQRFPAWGFGARPIDGPVSHCFNLNGSKYNHEVEGLHGILIAYSNALYNVSLAGPTLFGHVITKAASIARSSLENGERKYFVLLIITDGVVTDLQETKDAIVQASDLPFSILIVGVGGADFREMEILDGDKGERLESSTSRVATRDIVQFVPMRDVENGEMSVVQGLLAELPTQFLAYMRSRNLEP